MQGSKKRHSWNSRIPTPDSEFLHIITIPWNGQENYWWNDVCADVIEIFGLPGDRYTSRPKSTKMDFYFKSEKDALLCQILLSDKLS